MNDKIIDTVTSVISQTHMDAAYNILKGPTSQELKDLLASLMWTTGLQDDIDRFLEKYPHLRP